MIIRLGELTFHFILILLVAIKGLISDFATDVFSHRFVEYVVLIEDENHSVDFTIICNVIGFGYRCDLV